MSKTIYICEDCGREYNDRPPFPEPCVCGNICEEFYRLKDIYDEEDDKAGKPLLGVKYGKGVLEEKLAEKPKVIIQPIEKTEKPRIDYSEMTNKELRKVLDSKKIAYDKRLSKTKLIELIEGK